MAVKTTTQRKVTLRKRTTGTESCADTCNDCRRVCEQTLNYCIEQGGALADATHLTLLRDCIEVCAACANTCDRASPNCGTMCETCADVCMKCAESCEGFADDEQLRKCADACRACVETCQDMA